MNIKNFLNIPIDETPPELALSVELRCRDIMASNDIDNLKRYATHLVRHQARQDVFLASLLGLTLKPKSIALEAFARVTSVSVITPTADKIIFGVTSSCLTFSIASLTFSGDRHPAKTTGIFTESTIAFETFQS